MPWINGCEWRIAERSKFRRIISYDSKIIGSEDPLGFQSGHNGKSYSVIESNDRFGLVSFKA
jgi:hypothetical protein